MADSEWGSWGSAKALSTQNFIFMRIFFLDKSDKLPYLPYIFTPLDSLLYLFNKSILLPVIYVKLLGE